jgi:hypothetical protein
MHPIQDLFLESFSYELQFDMHFYMHSYLHKKNYSCKKWVLHLVWIWVELLPCYFVTLVAVMVMLILLVWRIGFAVTGI